jgi:hypothetical protein
MGLSISSTVAAKSVARWRENDVFTLQNGKIFHASPEHRGGTRVRGIDQVEDILVYKGKLIALKSEGEVLLLNEESEPGEGRWLPLASRTEKIATDGSDLFALVITKPFFWGKETREVRVFKGSPGELIWTLSSIQVPTPCGQNMCINTVVTPTVAGRQISFEPIDVKNVEDLVVENDDVFAVTSEGDKKIVSRD